jgi:hypothetical protein
VSCDAGVVVKFEPGAGRNGLVQIAARSASTVPARGAASLLCRFFSLAIAVDFPQYPADVGFLALP